MLQRPLTHCPEGQGNRAKGPWRSSREEGAEAKIREESRSPTGRVGPSPSLSRPPTPSLRNFGKAGLTGSASEQAPYPVPTQRAASRSHPGRGRQEWLWPENPAEPKGKEQRSQDEALDTGTSTPRGRCSSVPEPTPGWPPASACSLRNPQTPTQTWLQ